MRTLTLGLGALVCTVAILASTVNSATAEPRGHRDWNKAEQSGWRDGHRAYGYRPYDGPSVYYGAYYYDPYYYPPYPYYYAPAPYYGSSVSFSFGFEALIDPDNRVRRSLANDVNGVPISPTSGRAVKWCGLGAVIAA